MYPPSKLKDAADRIRERRSVRAADILEPGPSESEINEMLEIAVRVPDHGKLGPWRFLIFDGDSRQEFGELLRSQFAKTNPDSSEAILERAITKILTKRLHAEATRMVTHFVMAPCACSICACWK